MKNMKWTHKINTTNIKISQKNGLLQHLMPMCNGPTRSLTSLIGGGKMMNISKNGGPIEPTVQNPPSSPLRTKMTVGRCVMTKL